MVGRNNSVWSRMKEISPDCVQLKCICHSLALCVQYAVSKLPSNIGCLLSETPRWFCNNELRREAFKELFSVMKPSTDTESARCAPLPFEKPSSTRWLVRGKVMFNILLNWEELKAYYNCAELGADRMDAKYKARLLKEMFADYTNYLYFEFATPVVQVWWRNNIGKWFWSTGERSPPPFSSKPNGIPTDSEEFWVGVFQHRDFRELAKYALTCLVTPVSNAIVERMFSLVTSVKTKTRNRMQLQLLDAIVRLRAELMISNRCCKDFKASREMLQKFTTDTVYTKAAERGMTWTETLIWSFFFCNNDNKTHCSIDLAFFHAVWLFF